MLIIVCTYFNAGDPLLYTAGPYCSSTSLAAVINYYYYFRGLFSFNGNFRGFGSSTLSNTIITAVTNYYYRGLLGYDTGDMFFFNEYGS